MRATKMNKKTVAIVSAGLILAGAGGAYAYWTSAGSGSGTATTTVSNSTLTVTQTGQPSNMAPGVAPGAVTFTVTNNSATQSAQVNNVSISIASVTPGALNVGTPCLASDYILTQPTWVPVQLAASGVSSPNASATLGFVTNASNQDNCQGAVVNLSYAAS